MVEAGVNAVDFECAAMWSTTTATFHGSTRLNEWLDAACRVAARQEHFGLVYFGVNEPHALPPLLSQIRGALRRLAAHTHIRFTVRD
jgi:hypothetical protein